ncbi:hypothetical protein ACFB49_43890 [Sphingomonas sp. DBB INV C78]|uniref:nuclear transport factor 2 family protein n=1 Tax=Sphingomonas sp. DBB INV C78 TaxID=3349434 RepID=UPI0036D215AD
MLSLQEISDRLEIQDLFARYSFAIDDRNWAGLDEVFTEDAIIDYSEVGGPRLPFREMQAWLGEAMKAFKGFQHMVATTELKLDGDKATSRTILFNPMIMFPDGSEPKGNDKVFFVGLWYCDKLVRTEKGWRIAERREQKSYFHNAPPELAPPA